MRIVFIIAQLTEGGAEREAAAFVNELVRMGQEVHLICLHDKPDDYVVDERVHRHLAPGTGVQIPKLKGAVNIVLMTALLRRIRGDVAVLFYVPFHLAVLLSKTRLVHALRGNPEKERPSKSGRFREWLAYQCADGIWIQTEAQRQFFPDGMQGKLFEVHNILDSRFLQIRRAPRQQIMRFISVGRLHPQKNQKLLIEAFDRMIQKTGNMAATLTIYGRAHKDFAWVEEELRKQICQLGLTERVFLPGKERDMERRYEEADAFLLSSDYEGCPNALMEAMAAGLPCVSTDCPTGPSMLIQNNRNGLLVPVGDVESMAYAMEYLSVHPQEAEQLGRAAKQSMTKWGTPQEQAGQLLENLRRVCFGSKMQI